MANYSKDYNCPECKKEHTVDFHFFSPDDGDEETEEVVCDCGCEFECDVKVEVDYDFYATDPEVTKSGINKVEFDIMDTSTWPQQKPDPNQLTIL